MLEIDENTGVTDLEFDPSDPDTVYAAAYQRRRHVWAFLGGGPGSGIYKSTDGGETWREITDRAAHRRHGQDRPGRDARRSRPWSTPPSRPTTTSAASTAPRTGRELGDSATATSPAAPAPTTTRRSRRRPSTPDLVYQMDVFIQVTRDGGATFDNLGDRPREAQRQPRAVDRSRRTATTCSPAPTRASTRASTRAPPGGTSPTCRSRSSTRWRSTTPSPSTTSSAAPRTWARCTARRAPSTPRACATRTGTCPWAPTATASPSTPTDPDILYLETQEGSSSASTGAATRPSTSSRSPRPATRRSAGTGTRRS